MVDFLCLGHYVPELAEKIYDGNKNASKDNYINLKGFMVMLTEKHVTCIK